MRRRLALSAIVFLCLSSSASGRALHYVLFVTLQGTSGSASITGPQLDIDNISCPGHCTASFPTGAEYTVTIALGADTVFDGWAGDCSGTALTCTVKMDGIRAVYAYYRNKDALPLPGSPVPIKPPPPPTVNLTILKAGNGTGYVGGNAGIDCGPACAASPILGTDVQLVAVPDKGSVFSGWTGDCRGQGNPCNLTMAVDKKVIANFGRIDTKAPVVQAIPSAGARGQQAKLRYRVSDDTGRTREFATIEMGDRVLAQLHGELARIQNGKLYFLSWKVPASLSPGTLTFCVQSRDRVGHLSKISCAPLRIR